jgi:hypothetical protein
MQKRVAAAVVPLVLGVLFSECSSSPAAPTTPTTSSIAITGTVPAVGQTSQLDAKATLSNGTSQDVTTTATWSSSNTAVATITTGGLLKVLQVGGAQITATYQGASGQFSVNLQVASITVTGSTSMFQGQASNIPLTATATLSNGATQNITSQATWQSSNTSILNLDTAAGPGVVTNFTYANGILTPTVPLGVGVATISATYQGVTGNISITVKPPACQFTVGGGTPSSSPGIISTPYLSASGFTETFTVTMTSGGSGCGWQVVVRSLNGNYFLNELKVVSQGGTMDATPNVNTTLYSGGPTTLNGVGNATILVTVPANATGFQRSELMDILTLEYQINEGEGVEGLNDFSIGINQSN